MAKKITASQRRRLAERNSAYRNIAIVAVALSVIAYVFVTVVLRNRTLDKTTLCPALPDSVTVVLVDVTDPMTLPQRQDFLNQFDLLIEKIPRYGKLVIAKVDPVSDRLLTPVITRCNPGKSSDVSELTGNPVKLGAMYRQQFVAPIQSAFSKIALASEATRSPILESMQSINLTELQRGVSRDASRKLIVASDLLQHTSDVSFYKVMPDPNVFIESPGFRAVRTDLRGTDVELWMLQRRDSTTTQPRRLAELWERIIEVQGGRLVRVYTVSG